MAIPRGAGTSGSGEDGRFKELMPTVLRHGPYRFFFYSNEAGEPMHVHVGRDRDVAKFWLDPVRLQRSGGFSAAEVNRIARLVEEHSEEIIEAWHGHFGN